MKEYEQYCLNYYKFKDFKVITLIMVLFYLFTVYTIIGGRPIEYTLIVTFGIFLLFGFNTNKIALKLIIITSLVVLKLNFNESVSYLFKF